MQTSLRLKNAQWFRDGLVIKTHRLSNHPQPSTLNPQPSTLNPEAGIADRGDRGGGVLLFGTLHPPLLHQLPGGERSKPFSHEKTFILKLPDNEVYYTIFFI